MLDANGLAAGGNAAAAAGALVDEDVVVVAEASWLASVADAADPADWAEDAVVDGKAEIRSFSSRVNQLDWGIVLIFIMKFLCFARPGRFG